MQRRISRFGGQASTAWFDIMPAAGADTQQDAAGMKDTLGCLLGWRKARFSLHARAIWCLLGCSAILRFPKPSASPTPHNTKLTPPHATFPCSYVEHLLEQQAAAGVPPSQVIIGGFSQGGAMALLALRSQHSLAGVLALSAFMPLTAEQPLFAGGWAGAMALVCKGTGGWVRASSRGASPALRTGWVGGLLCWTAGVGCEQPHAKQCAFNAKNTTQPQHPCLPVTRRQ